MSKVCLILIDKCKYIYLKIYYIICKYTILYNFLVMTGGLFNYKPKKLELLIIYLNKYSMIVKLLNNMLLTLL